MLIEQYVADGTRMIDVDATLNDIKQHTQFIINEILAIKLPAEATVVSSKVSKSVPKVSELGKKNVNVKHIKIKRTSKYWF